MFYINCCPGTIPGVDNDTGRDHAISESSTLATSSTTPTTRARGHATRERLKHIAETLFAEHGVDAVTVRDIVKAAGLKNVASLNYYFGGKQGLVEALILDGARASDTWRQERLDALAERGEPSVRELIRVLAWPVLSTNPVRVATDTHIRFINHVMAVNRRLFDDTVGRGCNQGYQRCLALLRERIDLPVDTLNERFIFINIYLRAAFAARETETARHPRNNIWNRTATIEHLFDTVEAILTARV